LFYGIHAIKHHILLEQFEPVSFCFPSLANFGNFISDIRLLSESGAVTACVVDVDAIGAVTAGVVDVDAIGEVTAGVVVKDNFRFRVTLSVSGHLGSRLRKIQRITHIYIYLAIITLARLYSVCKMYP
jgi:hypothetical protein